MNQERPRVFVLGMHRSGTSLLSRLVHEFGFFVGDDDELMPAQPCNVEGFWERVDVSELNERILTALEGSWDCPPSLPKLAAGLVGGGEGKSFAPLVEAARGIVERLDREGSWSVKDPRLSLTWPFWRALVDRPRVLVAIRDPFEVAASLVARHGCSEALGLSLWLSYNEAILRFTTPEERFVVDYHALMAQPEREARRIAQALGQEPSDSALVMAARVVSDGLRTHRSQSTAARLRAPRYARHRKVYATLLTEAGVDARRALEVAPWPLGRTVESTIAHGEFGAFVDGWSPPEPQGVWSHGPRARLKVGPLRRTRSTRGYTVSLGVVPFIAAGGRAQRVRISAGAAVLLEATLTEAQLQELVCACAAEHVTDGELWLTLEFPDAASPASLGLGPDLRKLGVLVGSVRVEASRGARRSPVPSGDGGAHA